jgi:hypothetical protein
MRAQQEEVSTRLMSRKKAKTWRGVRHVLEHC